MKAIELRGRQADDLHRELEQLRREQLDMRFQWQSEENADTSHERKLRRDIARIKTVLRELELAAEAEGATDN